MSARDKLATIIGEQFEHPAGGNCPGCADARRAAEAVIEAGYVKHTNEQTAAVTTMERIQATMDAFFKGEAGQFETLGKLAEHLGAYEMERL